MIMILGLEKYYWKYIAMKDFTDYSEAGIVYK